VDDLAGVVDMAAIRSGGVRIGVDPLGGAGVQYWEPIIARYGIDVTVVNNEIDPTFRFVTVDWDGKIRTVCSSPYAMVPLVAIRDRFDVAFANDADHDRHGIVTPSAGLMNPNYYLAVAISYLFTHRHRWSSQTRCGEDRRQQRHDRPRSRAPGTPAHRGTGRVQVVCRRHLVDDGQGRNHSRSARG
jgi:phosphoglucomutase